jgi:DNA-binding NtrC family response regulator
VKQKNYRPSVIVYYLNITNRIERYVLLDDEEELTQNMFPNVINEQNKSGLPQFEMPISGFNWEQFERYCLSEALKINQGNKTKAAKYLNLPYKAFLYRLEKFQISPNIT